MTETWHSPWDGGAEGLATVNWVGAGTGRGVTETGVAGVTAL